LLTEEFGKGALGMVVLDKLQCLEQSMHISMATLRVATTRHHYSDIVSRYTCTYNVLPSPAKGREVRE